jgi:hypothetical protein
VQGCAAAKIVPCDLSTWGIFQQHGIVICSEKRVSKPLPMLDDLRDDLVSWFLDPCSGGLSRGFFYLVLMKCLCEYVVIQIKDRFLLYMCQMLFPCLAKLIKN